MRMDFVTKVFSLSAFLAKSRQAVKQVCNQFFRFCPKMFIEVFWLSVGCYILRLCKPVKTSSLNLYVNILLALSHASVNPE